jgi:hypothetical protein
MSYIDIVICTGPDRFLETWPPIYGGQERPVRDRLRVSQVDHHIYSWYTPCSTDLYLPVHPMPCSPDPKSFILDIFWVNPHHRRQAWWWRRPPVVIPLSDRVPGRASRPSRSRINDSDGLQYVFWKIDQALRVFSSRRIYRRKGNVRRWTKGPHHAPAQPRGGTRHGGCGCPLSPLRLCFGLRLISGKIGTSAFVSSNSENISRVTLLKHKNNRKQGTGTVASR